MLDEILDMTPEAISEIDGLDDDGATAVQNIITELTKAATEEGDAEAAPDEAVVTTEEAEAEVEVPEDEATEVVAEAEAEVADAEAAPEKSAEGSAPSA